MPRQAAIRKILLSFAIFAGAADLQAQSTWDGGGANNLMRNATNWAGDTIPDVGSDLAFAGSTRTAPTNNNSAAQGIFNSITFESGASSFTIVGVTNMTLSNSIVNNSSVLQTISNPIVLGGNLTVNAASGNINLLSAISGSNTLTKSGANTLLLGGNNTYTNATIVNAGTVVLSNANASTSYTLNGGSVTTVGANRIADTASLLLSNAASTFTVGTNETVGIISGTAGNVAVSGGTLTNLFNAASATYSGTMSGVGGFTKAGTGTLTLGGSGANTLSGNVNVSAGLLELNKTAGTDAIAGNVTVAVGAGLTNTASNQINDGRSVTISGITSSGGAWSLGANVSETIAALALNAGATLSLGVNSQVAVSGGTNALAGKLAGANGSSLVFNSGSTTITGDNSAAAGGLQSGSAVYALGGTLFLNNNNAAGSSTVYLGDTTGSASATLDSSTALSRVIGNAIFVQEGSSGIKTLGNSITVAGRSITYTGPMTLDDSVTVNAPTDNTTRFSGVISSDPDADQEGVTKRGFGTIEIETDMTFTGGFSVDEGSAVFFNGAGITSASGIAIGNSSLNAGTGWASLTLGNADGGADTVTRNISVASGVGQRLLLSENNNNVTGTISLSGNLTISNAVIGTLTLSGLTMNASGNNDVDLIDDGNVTLGGSITSSSVASEINKLGASTLVISGNSAGAVYTLNISNGGSVVLSNANALGTGHAGQLNFATDANLQVRANVSSSNAGMVLADGVTATVNVNAGNNLSIATLGLSGGTGTYLKTGSGTLTLNSASSDNYALDISEGTVGINHADALGTASSEKVTFTGNSTLRVNANVAPADLGLRIGDGVTAGVNVTSGNNFTVATLSDVAGAGTFNKNGTGTMTLTGASTVAGANNINAGTLAVDVGATLGGTTTVNNGGTLVANGAVGATTVNSGALLTGSGVVEYATISGRIAPGNSPGSITNEGDMTWIGGTGSYDWEIFNVAGTPGSDWDFIHVTQELNITGLSPENRFTINIIAPGALAGWNAASATDQSWTILTAGSFISGFDANNFTLNLANFTNNNSLNGGLFSLAADDNDLNILFRAGSGPGPEPIPEPGTWAAAALLLAAAGYVRWRRRPATEPTR